MALHKAMTIAGSDTSGGAGMEADLKEIEKDIEDRDYRDMHREHSPLKQAEDAVLLDTSSMTLDQVVEEILKIVREKGYKAAGGCA